MRRSRIPLTTRNWLRFTATFQQSERVTLHRGTFESVSKVVTGNPDPQFVSTSYIERQNLTIRMMSRRFTRLTNAFSKKLSHLKAAISLHFAYYNLCRVHASLRVTPAMQAGITDHIWDIRALLYS